LAPPNLLETRAQLLLFFVDKQYHVAALYIAMQHIDNKQVGGELKKGSAELLILSLIEHRPRHGYEISKLIETRSEGILRFNVASLYPLLYRLEQRGLIKGQWVEKPGQRRRRFYHLTAQGRKMLKHQQGMWREFVNAMALITGAENA
jgi:transcriptional regulator